MSRKHLVGDPHLPRKVFFDPEMTHQNETEVQKKKENTVAKNTKRDRTDAVPDLPLCLALIVCV